MNNSDTAVNLQVGISTPGDVNLDGLSVDELREKVKELCSINNELKKRNDLLTRAAGELERLSAEDALREAEWKFQALFDKGPIGVAYHEMIYDESGNPVDYRVIDANESYIKLTGVDPRGMYVTKAFPGIELDPFDWIGVYGRVARTGEPVRFEQYFKLVNRWYDCSAYQYKPDQFVVAFLDITDRKRAELALVEKEIQYRNLADSGLALIWTAGVDKLCNYFNKPWLNFTGRTLEQELGNGWVEGVHPDDYDRCLKIYVTAFDKRESFDMEYRLLHASGEYRWIQDLGSPTHNGRGDFSGYVGHCFDITDRKQLEEKGKTILHTTIDGYLLVDNNGRFVDANDSYCKMIGYNRDELLNMGLKDVEAIEAEDDVKDRMRHIQENGYASFETRHRCKDGLIVDIEVSITALKQDEGYLVVFMRDITARKRVEQDLRYRERDLKASQRLAKVGRWRLDIATNKVVWSEELYRMYGADPSLPPPPYTEHMKLFTPESWEKLSTAIANTIENKVPYELELNTVKKGGNKGWIWVRGEVDVDSEGKVVSLWGVTQDIDERKQAELALESSNKSFRTLAELSPVGIYLTSPEGACSYANPVWCQMAGLSLTEALGQGWVKGLHPDDRASVFAHWQQMVASNGKWGMEYRFQTPEGKVTQVYGLATPHHDSSGKTIGYVGVNIDITERKRAEEREKVLLEKLERATRMESLGVLAGGVAHDLNNVLGPIVVLPDMVADYVKRHKDETDEEYNETVESLQVMKTSALRAKSVISDLVVMGRRGQLQKFPMDVNQVLEDALDSKQIKALLDRWSDVKIVKMLTKEPAWCLGSDSRMVRVVTNLVGNAAEAISGQGDIVISTNRNVFAEPYRGYDTVPAGTYVTIGIADNGCGMDAKTLARIFEPFFSTKAASERSGSGLGLSVVHGLVKDHDGFLDVKSELDKGTTFTIFLPAVDPVTAATFSVETHVSCGNERILVVDDEPGQLVLSKRALKKLGYDATVVSSGEEAVKLFRESALTGKPAPFDLVITDMVMEGMDGMTLCQNILKLYPSQKLIVASGHSAEEKMNQAKTVGVDWLVKPYTAEDLARAVRARLDR